MSFDTVHDLALAREVMPGAGDIFDIIHVVQQPFPGQFRIDQPDEQLMVILFELMFFRVKLGNMDKAIRAGKKRVEEKQPDKGNKPQKHFSADAYICVGQPLDDILFKRIEQCFFIQPQFRPPSPLRFTHRV